MMALIKEWKLFIVLAIVFFTFSPTLSNEFVNWDDDVHLLANPFVQTLDPLHIKDIFTTTVNKIYIPLTSLSFAIEYHFFKTNPFYYHLDNLILHLIVTGLVYLFARQCLLTEVAALLAALLFGIHPMHVESVAWVTERKDVLYSAFYLLSLISYCHYIKQAKARLFVLTVLFGLLSVLAKPMALSLPLVFLLCDWYFRRHFNRRVWLEKLYVVIFLFPFVWVTYFLQARIFSSSLSESALVWIWSFMFYLKKFFYPDYFVHFYGLSHPVVITNLVYACGVTMFLVLGGCLYYFRRQRMFIFAFFYFFFSIFFLLRIDMGHDLHIVADRFMYLPSLGWCFLFGSGTVQLFLYFKEKKIVQVLLCLGVTTLMMFLGCKTFQQTFVWRHSVSLWEHQRQHKPKVATALVLNKLAQAYMNVFEKQNTLDRYRVQKVELLFKRALRINPRYANAYWGLGELYLKTGNHGRAQQSLQKAIGIDPKHFGAQFSIGKLYYAMGFPKKGFRYFVRAMDVQAENTNLYKQIVSFYGQFPQLKEDLSQFEEKYKQILLKGF